MRIRRCRVHQSSLQAKLWARRLKGHLHMAKQRTTFAKLQRERAKAARKAEKQAARINGGSTPDPVEEVVEEVEDLELDLESMTPVERMFAGKGRLSAPELMAMTEKIQRAHQRGDLSDDELEDAKLELLERIE